MTTTFLEELKAAQEVIDALDGWDCEDLFFDEMLHLDEAKKLSDVLRRIPQLIDMLEMIEGYANLGRGEVVLDNKYTQRQHFAVDILTKLEGDKGE